MMQACSAQKLHWLQPRHAGTDEFDPVKSELESTLVHPRARPVYSVNTRSIYLSNTGPFAPLAIKELRFETPLRRWRATTIQRHRVLCEFNAAACFATRGGVTPKLYAAAIERRDVQISRVFIFLEWLEGAVSLSSAMKSWSDSQRDENLRQLAAALVDHASRGLVHGRHSSENILVTEGPQFSVIDFSHAQLFAKFHPAGFMRDVARIGARLLLEEACDRTTVLDLFEDVTKLSRSLDVRADKMAKELDNVLSHSKWRQRRQRNWRTFWRGLPARLHDGSA